MPEVLIICTYCGKQLKRSIWSMAEVEDMVCTKCGDTQLIAKRIDTTDVFGYNSDAPKDDAYIKRRK
jgi:hypothetical protein